MTIFSYTTTTSKLNKKNFDDWYKKVNKNLREKGVKRYTESDFLNDLIIENKKRQSSGQPTIEITGHIKNDTQAIQIITKSLPPELVSGIVNFHTSYRMMEKLKRDYIENYEGNTENLYLKLANVRAANLMESIKIIDELNKIFKQMDIAENSLTDNEKSKFLYSSISEDAMEHFNVHLVNNYDKLCRYFRLSVHMKNIKDNPNYKSNKSSLDLRNESDSDYSFGNGSINMRGYEIERSHSHSPIHYSHSHSHTHTHNHSHSNSHSNSHSHSHSPSHVHSPKTKHTYGNIHSSSNTPSHSRPHSRSNSRSRSNSHTQLQELAHSSSTRSNSRSRSNSHTQLQELAHSSSTLSRNHGNKNGKHNNSNTKNHSGYTSRSNSSTSLSNSFHSKYGHMGDSNSFVENNSKNKSKLYNKKSNRSNKYKYSEGSPQLHAKNSYIDNNSSFYIVERALASLEKKG
ncbi:hypothetical protein PIROE2DRAFT_12543 [Piromyces sp. E2]|nr:hypothetical protein PIROE2DRAFT_12543 [Piromyces sp. E2]|eukprot:OUM61444.1 hypothetical protein PIROE2DRAFT_12543 [Piromyces sp. E2]